MPALAALAARALPVLSAGLGLLLPVTAEPPVGRLLTRVRPLAAGALRVRLGQVLPEGRGSRTRGLLAVLALGVLAPPTLLRCWQGWQRRRFLLLVAGAPRVR